MVFGEYWQSRAFLDDSAGRAGGQATVRLDCWARSAKPAESAVKPFPVPVASARDDEKIATAGNSRIMSTFCPGVVRPMTIDLPANPSGHWWSGHTFAKVLNRQPFQLAFLIGLASRQKLPSPEGMPDFARFAGWVKGEKGEWTVSGGRDHKGCVSESGL